MENLSIELELYLTDEENAKSIPLFSDLLDILNSSMKCALENGTDEITLSKGKRIPISKFALIELIGDHLMRALSLNRFGVIGNSAGSAYGLACAYRLGNRIDRLVLVSGIAPFSHIGDLDGMYTPLRRFLSLGKHARSLLEPLIKLI